MSVSQSKPGQALDALHPAKTGAKVRNIFKHYLLKPAVIGTAVLVISLASLNSAASAKAPAAKSQKDIIVLQSDTLAVKPSVQTKALPPAMQAEIQAILSKISHAYPDVLKAWAAGRQLDMPSELKPLELKVQLVNHAKFDQIEYAGSSVKTDPDAQTIYINSDAKLNTGELAFALCSTFASYGGFKEIMPFHEMSIIPFVMAYSISPSTPFMASPDGDAPPVLRDRQAAALWFAQFIGPEKFVNAYASSNTDLLRKAYDQKFGAGRYAELMALSYQWAGPGYPRPDSSKVMETISKHIHQAGEKGTAWEQADPLAAKLGWKLQPKD